MHTQCSCHRLQQSVFCLSAFCSVYRKHGERAHAPVIDFACEPCFQSVDASAVAVVVAFSDTCVFVVHVLVGL